MERISKPAVKEVINSIKNIWNVLSRQRYGDERQFNLAANKL